MGHPLHAFTCSSVTYRWGCPECGGAVFVYECSCGSFVMFDQLGHPWLQHSCFRNLYRELEARVGPILRDGASSSSATFKPFRDLKDRVTRLAEEKGVSEPNPAPEPVHPLRRAENRTKRMDPVSMNEQLQLIGIVREIENDTAFLRSLFEMGDLGRKLFDLPARMNARQLTIVDAGGLPNESYTAVVSARQLTGIEPGVTVFSVLCGKIQGPLKAWVVKAIDAI